jgi:hypothetical protein
MRIVDVEKIRGSVGRYEDFDGSFLPLKVDMAHRWGRIDRAYHKGDELPAVSLYKVGEAYFVRDGNHRVSVAKYHKVAIAASPVHQPQHAPEPGASLLHNLWQRLRPGLLRPGARPVT